MFAPQAAESIDARRAPLSGAVHATLLMADLSDATNNTTSSSNYVVRLVCAAAPASAPASWSSKKAKGPNPIWFSHSSSSSLRWFRSSSFFSFLQCPAGTPTITVSVDVYEHRGLFRSNKLVGSGTIELRTGEALDASTRVCVLTREDGSSPVGSVSFCIDAVFCLAPYGNDHLQVADLPLPPSCAVAFADSTIMLHLPGVPLTVIVELAQRLYDVLHEAGVSPLTMLAPRTAEAAENEPVRVAWSCTAGSTSWLNMTPPHLRVLGPALALVDLLGALGFAPISSEWTCARLAEHAVLEMQIGHLLLRRAHALTHYEAVRRHLLVELHPTLPQHLILLGVPALQIERAELSEPRLTKTEFALAAQERGSDGHHRELRIDLSTRRTDVGRFSGDLYRVNQQFAELAHLRAVDLLEQHYGALLVTAMGSAVLMAIPSDRDAARAAPLHALPDIATRVRVEFFANPVFGVGAKAVTIGGLQLDEQMVHTRVLPDRITLPTCIDERNVIFTSEVHGGSGDFPSSAAVHRHALGLYALNNLLRVGYVVDCTQRRAVVLRHSPSEAGRAQSYAVLEWEAHRRGTRPQAHALYTDVPASVVLSSLVGGNFALKEVSEHASEKVVLLQHTPGSADEVNGALRMRCAQIFALNRLTLCGLNVINMLDQSFNSEQPGLLMQRWRAPLLFPGEHMVISHLHTVSVTSRSVYICLEHADERLRHVLAAGAGVQKVVILRCSVGVCYKVMLAERIAMVLPLGTKAGIGATSSFVQIISTAMSLGWLPVRTTLRSVLLYRPTNAPTGSTESLPVIVNPSSTKDIAAADKAHVQTETARPAKPASPRAAPSAAAPTAAPRANSAAVPLYPKEEAPSAEEFARMQRELIALTEKVQQQQQQLCEQAQLIESYETQLRAIEEESEVGGEESEDVLEGEESEEVVDEEADADVELLLANAPAPPPYALVASQRIYYPPMSAGDEEPEEGEQEAVAEPAA